MAALEVEAIPEAPEMETVVVAEAETALEGADVIALDGRAIEIAAPADDADLELLDDEAPTEVVLEAGEATELLAPACEAVVELQEDEADVALEVAEEPTVLEPETVEVEMVEAEVILETEETAPPSSETVPDLGEPEANRDELFDRENTNLSAGLDEDA